MIIDEKGKLFGKISIIDLSVAVILLLAIIGGILVYGFSNADKTAPLGINGGDTINKVTVKLVVEDVRDITRDAFKEGDSVYAALEKKLIGEVAKVESKPHQALVTSVDGTMVYSDVPEKYKVTIYLKTWGIETGKGCLTENDLEICAGQEFIIKNIKAMTTVAVDEITVDSEKTKVL